MSNFIQKKYLYVRVVGMILVIAGFATLTFSLFSPEGDQSTVHTFSRMVGEHHTRELANRVYSDYSDYKKYRTMNVGVATTSTSTLVMYEATLNDARSDSLKDSIGSRTKKALGQSTQTAHADAESEAPSIAESIPSASTADAAGMTTLARANTNSNGRGVGPRKYRTPVVTEPEPMEEEHITTPSPTPSEEVQEAKDIHEEYVEEEEPSPIEQIEASVEENQEPSHQPVALPRSALNASVQAWIYPGNPACAAHSEFKDGRTIDVLKPEYFTVAASGALTLLTTATAGCNGYSQANAAEVRAYSREQYVTISSDATRMRALVTNADRRRSAIDTLISFVADNQFTGIELDFEGYSHWSQADYEGFKTFVRDLGNALHAQSNKLQIDAPPIGTALEQSYYLLTYAELAELPINQIVIMAYDYMYDHGAGTAISPTDWVTTIVNRAKREIGDLNRIVIGIPSYGYRGVTDTYSPTLLTYDQMRSLAGFSSARSDSSSFELMWTQAGESFICNDTSTMDAKRAHIESLGIRHISVWHLGGNQWFSR